MIHEMRKSALITGATGQDGYYLVKLLLKKNYELTLLVRDNSRRSKTTLFEDLELTDEEIARTKVSPGDLLDESSIKHALAESSPAEVYNLAAQSHVGYSFEAPCYTAEVNALGPLKLLEAIRTSGRREDIKFYQASTSELYGKVQEIPQTENTRFYPRSPYGVAKLFAFWITVNYREAFGMFACNGILFNHESPRRGLNFVTRKITFSLARIFKGADEILELGNLDALRDWGHARDYVEMQWLMLQQPEPRDFVIATGRQATVRDFVLLAAESLGVTIEFSGSGLGEVGIVSAISPDSPALKRLIGRVILRVNPRFYRPAEVETLLGSPIKANELLGWVPATTLAQLAEEMMQHDFRRAESY